MSDLETAVMLTYGATLRLASYSCDLFGGLGLCRVRLVVFDREQSDGRERRHVDC